MLKIKGVRVLYIAYRCKICAKTFILLTSEVKHSEEESRYITCPYNGKHKNITVCSRYSDLKECMNHAVYVREGGRMKQIK